MKNLKTNSFKICYCLDWRPGLVVMVGDSCSEGRGFETQYRHFNIKLLQKTENKQKEAGNGPFLEKCAICSTSLEQFSNNCSQPKNSRQSLPQTSMDLGI